MKCGSCGHVNIAGLLFCGSCGAPIRPERHLVDLNAEEVAIRKARSTLAANLRAALVAGAVFFAAAVAFRAVHTRDALPRFQEIPVAPIFPDLPVQDAELLAHPWLALPVPETR